MGGQLATLQHEGSAAINAMQRRQILDANEYYKNDPQIRADVDAMLDNALAPGQMASENLLRKALDAAVGSHAQRLITEASEAAIRQQRGNPEDLPPVPASQRRGLQPTRQPGRSYAEDLTENHFAALAQLNNGRGCSPDEFATDKLGSYKYFARGTDAQGRPTRERREIVYSSYDDMYERVERNNELFAEQQARMMGRAVASNN